MHSSFSSFFFFVLSSPDRPSLLQWISVKTGEGRWGKVLILFLATLGFPASLSLNSLATPDGKYHIFSKPLSIAAGDTLTIPMGSELLFAPFSGILLDGGVLLAQGTREKPIFFSSIRDTSNSAAPYDWNGIDIKKGSFANLSFCALSYSSSGITAEDSQSLSLDNCIFYANGQWSLSMANVTSQTEDKTPISYVCSSCPVKPCETQATPPENQLAQKWPNRLFLGIGLLTAAAGTLCLVQAAQTANTYNAYVPGNPSFDNTSPENRQDMFDNYRHDYNHWLGLGWGCLGLGMGNIYVFLRKNNVFGTRSLR